MSEHVGPYRVLRAIGAGGTARIDLAVLERAYGFERHVVLKRPLEHLRTDPAVARTLRREAALGGRLVHPNLIAVLDAGTQDGYDFLALEYVDGLSLRELMRESDGEVRALPLVATLSIVIDAARGLHEAHELAADDGSPLGLVHRDVSPANVLLGKDGTVKLSDFGIAKDTRVDTLSGSMRGTVTYMAPEQCRGHAFDRRADVFALGVILHELLTHRRLFWADNDVASLHRVLSGDVPDPREIDQTIAPELAELTMRALAHDPMTRLATAAELADELEAFAVSAGMITGRHEVARAIASATQVTTAVTARVAPMVVTSEEPSLIPVIRRATSRRWLAVPLVIAIAGGAVLVWRASQHAAPPATVELAPVPRVATPLAPVAPAAPPPEVTEPIAVKPSHTDPDKPHSRTRRHTTKRPLAKADPKAPATTPETQPTKPAQTGSGKVEWNRTMVLPSDEGAKRK